IDADWYKTWYIDVLLPAIKLKMPWLRSRVVQQDGASPHTGKGNPEILNSARMGRGWMVELVTQPAQSPDLLGLLRISQVKGMGDERQFDR
ncbi:unnamed protein product, partial [Laminaria digitata]